MAILYRISRKEKSVCLDMNLAKKRKLAFRPLIEYLEDRSLPSIYTFVGGNNNNDWNVAANWVDENNNNAVPGTADTAIIPTGMTCMASSGTITVNKLRWTPLSRPKKCFP